MVQLTKELKKQRQRIFSYSFDPSGDLLSESYFITTKLETEGFIWITDIFKCSNEGN